MLGIFARTAAFSGLGLFGIRGFVIDISPVMLFMLLLLTALTITLAIERFSDQKPALIGERAVRKGMMTLDEVFHVLDCQGDCGRRFGEIAIEKGLLTERQIHRLMAEVST